MPRFSPVIPCALAAITSALLLFVAPKPVFADEEPDARLTLAYDMANTTLAILKDQRMPVSDRQAVLQNGFANVMDIDWIARFVLGSAWRTATPEQRAHYTDLYRTYLTMVYVSTYAESSERQITGIRVLGVADAGNERFTTRTEIALSTGEALSVDYLADKNREGDGYKIIDVAIEGVSLLATHRAEFGKLAAERGVEGVIARLERLTQPERGVITLSMK